METVAMGVEVFDDCVDRPVPVVVEHIAAVAFSQQLGVEVRSSRPGLGVRADADFVCLVCGHSRTVPKDERVDGREVAR